MEKAIVMNKAWEIARQGVEKFGGKVKEYFAKALKIAWALIKKEEKQMIEMKGTEKQVKWANDIYPRVTEKIETVIQEMEEWANKKAGRKRGYTRYVELFEEMKKNDSAAFWIDRFGYDKTYLEVISKFQSYVTEKEGSDKVIQLIRNNDFRTAIMLDNK